MFTNQEQLEFQYSKKHVKATVLDYIDTETPEFMYTMNQVYKYLNTTYSYKSKDIRIQHLLNQQIELDELVLEILIAVLLVQSINPIQGVCSKLLPVLNFEDRIDGVKTAAELLAVARGYYFDIYAHDYWDNPTGTMGIKSNLVIDLELKDYLNNLQYLPPMLEKPEVWEFNTGGGLQTVNDSVILGDANHHEDTQCLDVNNILQSVRYTLNETVMSLKEVPKHELVTNIQRVQSDKFINKSKQLYEQYQDTPFYFIWKNDKRGRLYSQGYHINPQGSEYKKASIDFFDKQLITG